MKAYQKLQKVKMNTRKLHQTGVKKQEEMKNTEESIEK